MYAVELSPELKQQMADLHPKRYKQIVLRIFDLQSNPRPPDSTMLDDEMYIVRVGPYKIAYSINDSEARVQIQTIQERIQNDTDA